MDKRILVFQWMFDYVVGQEGFDTDNGPSSTGEQQLLRALARIIDEQGSEEALDDSATCVWNIRFLILSVIKLMRRAEGDSAILEEALEVFREVFSDGVADEWMTRFRELEAEFQVQAFFARVTKEGVAPRVALFRSFKEDSKNELVQAKRKAIESGLKRKGRPNIGKIKRSVECAGGYAAFSESVGVLLKTYERVVCGKPFLDKVLDDVSSGKYVPGETGHDEKSPQRRRQIETTTEITRAEVPIEKKRAAVDEEVPDSTSEDAQEAAGRLEGQTARLRNMGTDPLQAAAAARTSREVGELKRKRSLLERSSQAEPVEWSSESENTPPAKKINAPPAPVISEYPPTLAVKQGLPEKEKTETQERRRVSGYPARRQRWTEEEDYALIAGMHAHGSGHWRDILNDGRYSDALAGRSNVALKDRWRVLQKYLKPTSDGKSDDDDG